MQPFSTRRARSSRRPHRSRGVAAVEFAIIAPLFFGVLLAIVEGSLLMRDHLTIANITGDAGRAASTYGRDIDADFQIIQEVEQAASALGGDQIIRIVVFKASGPDTDVPTACRNGTSVSSGSNPCNVYPAAALDDDDPTHFSCDTSEPFSSYAWCPTTRKVALQGTGGPPDYLGVYVRIRHDAVTGAFGGDRIMERTSIFRLEPQVLNG